MNTSHLLPDKMVCCVCLNDDGLSRLVRDKGTIGQCGYCWSPKPNVEIFPLTLVLKEAERRIRKEWCDPSRTDVPFRYIEDYLSGCYSFSEVMDRIGWEIPNWTLRTDCVQAFGDHEWRRIKWLNGANTISSAWEEFKHTVKYERRYTFLGGTKGETNRKKSTARTIQNLFSTIDGACRRASLITQFDTGNKFWRGRVFNSDDTPNIPSDLTSPPIKCCTAPNRMSPPGIAMFYGADDFDTAKMEVAASSGRTPLAAKTFIGVQFANVIPLTILDLTQINPRSSYFDDDSAADKAICNFLIGFAEDVSMPIEKAQRKSIDYVPTQVFTEYVKYVMKGMARRSINGIKYRSAHTERGCWVIFANQSECLANMDPEQGRVSRQILGCVDGSIRSEEIQ